MTRDYGEAILKLIDRQNKEKALERQKQLDALPKTEMTVERFVLEKCQLHLNNIFISYEQGCRDLTVNDYFLSTECDLSDFWDVIQDIEKEYQIEFTSEPLYVLSEELNSLWYNGKVLDLIALTRKKIAKKDNKNDLQ